tara:strand:- start:13535 stop:14530 length:996 start_codon:yes stop_codon:yes gene_type:complete
MKDIKPNQEGLMSLAKERPDVVEKMGYDPDSFAAGGIAMLEAGGMAMDPDMAIEVFKQKQGIEGFFLGGMSNKDKNKSSAFAKKEEMDEDETILDKIRKRIGELDMPDSFFDYQDTMMPETLTEGGIGQFNPINIPEIRRAQDGGIMSLDDELKRIIDKLPNLSSKEKNLQKALVDLQRAQQYVPDTAQFIESDSPLKAIYRPYYSEVTRAYNVGRPGRFDPMAAAPAERVQFNLNPRRIEGQLYAADGMMVDGQMFPDRDDLVTGPGGERDDKIPAMLSDGEFITNAKAVRGIGALAGAPADDPFAQRMEGAKQMYALQKAAEEYMGMMS